MTPRRVTGDARRWKALSHPLRQEILGHLGEHEAATATTIAAALGENTGTTSYHLRVLAEVGLVGEVSSADGRERPWEALITGFETDSDTSGGSMTAQESRLLAVSLQRYQKLVRDYMARREGEPRQWRKADFYGTYTLSLTPDELTNLSARLDAVIRPYIAATRELRDPDAELVHVNVHAFRNPGT